MSALPEREPYVNTQAVADFLDLAPSTVQDKFERGELPGYRLGHKHGRIRFKLSEVDDAIRRGRVAAAIEEDPPVVDLSERRRERSA